MSGIHVIDSHPEGEPTRLVVALRCEPVDPEAAAGSRIAPVVTGRAGVTAEAWSVREADDPFRDGIPPAGAP